MYSPTALKLFVTYYPRPMITKLPLSEVSGLALHMLECVLGVSFSHQMLMSSCKSCALSWSADNMHI